MCSLFGARRVRRLSGEGRRDRYRAPQADTIVAEGLFRRQPQGLRDRNCEAAAVPVDWQ